MVSEPVSDAACFQCPAVRGCAESCEQALAIVDSLSDAQYAAPAGGHSSVGAHMRHVIDHFLCFFRGLDEGEVDYDARDRAAELESSRAAFREVAGQIRARLLELDRSDVTRAVAIRQIPASGAESVALRSTVERELLFLMSHTIHHLALIKLLVALHGVALPESLGVAFSTLAHREEEARQASRGN